MKYAPTCMGIENIMLCEIKHGVKDQYCMIPLQGLETLPLQGLCREVKTDAFQVSRESRVSSRHVACKQVGGEWNREWRALLTV